MKRPKYLLLQAIQSLLDTSIYYLNLTPGSKVPSADDIVYAGDGGKWLRLAYSLKARYYLHVRKRDNTALTKAAAAAPRAAREPATSTASDLRPLH